MNKVGKAAVRTGWVLLLAAVWASMTVVWAQEEPEEEVTGEVILHGPEPPPFFGYDGPLGPEFWGDLSASWRTCSTGRAQTPIDISARDVRLALRGRGPVPVLGFDYHESSANTINNTHTIQFNYDPGSFLEVGPNRRFQLLQFHFHTPSEHTFEGGAQFPLEIHLVHREDGGARAVVGVLVREGEELHGFEPERLAQLLPQVGVVEYHLESHVNAEDLLPENRRTYFYMGSLTTPPCDEGLLWFVLKEPLEMSREQIEVIRTSLNRLRFASRQGSNARPVQPLNGRTVFLEFP